MTIKELADALLSLPDYAKESTAYIKTEQGRIAITGVNGADGIYWIDALPAGQRKEP